MITCIDHTPEDTAILARVMDAPAYLSTLWQERRDARAMRSMVRASTDTLPFQRPARWAFLGLSATDLADIVQF
jgi:hypothetical protein